MKKELLLTIILLAVSVLPVKAVCTTCQNTNQAQEATASGWRQQEREKIQELRQEALQNRQNLENMRIHIREAKVESIVSDTLTVSKDGTTYTIMITSTTRLVRKYGAKADLSEFRTGDIVSVVGKFTDEAKTTIEARIVRNLTIQKRWGVFFGTVATADGMNQLTMTTAKRGAQAVIVDGNTKLVNRKMEVIGLTQILVGHKIRVKGVWDNQSNTIRETDQIKDYSIPARSTPTPRAGINE